MRKAINGGVKTELPGSGSNGDRNPFLIQFQYNTFHLIWFVTSKKGQEFYPNLGINIKSNYFKAVFVL